MEIVFKIPSDASLSRVLNLNANPPTLFELRPFVAVLVFPSIIPSKRQIFSHLLKLCNACERTPLIPKPACVLSLLVLLFLGVCVLGIYTVVTSVIAVIIIVIIVIAI